MRKDAPETHVMYLYIPNHERGSTIMNPVRIVQKLSACAAFMPPARSQETVFCFGHLRHMRRVRSGKTGKSTSNAACMVSLSVVVSSGLRKVRHLVTKNRCTCDCLWAKQIRGGASAYLTIAFDVEAICGEASCEFMYYCLCEFTC